MLLQTALYTIKTSKMFVVLLSRRGDWSSRPDRPKRGDWRDRSSRSDRPKRGDWGVLFRKGDYL